MITEKTVFILGAGASCSYGLPSGPELKNLIAEQCINANDDNNNSYSFRHLERHGFKYDVVGRCRDFALALMGSGQASIDAFLNANRHQEGFEILGKAAAAQILLKYEAKVKSGDDDWIDYLVKEMISGAHSAADFSKNAVSFITFNYDRILEMSLLNKIKSSYGLRSEDARSVFSTFPIHHVYGDLGEFTDRIIATTTDSWLQASRRIRTIYDVVDGQIARIAEAEIKSARSVVMLGFGFHKENIEILGLPQLARDTNSTWSTSAYGVTEAEWMRMARAFSGTGPQFVRSPSHMKCRDALRELPWC